MQKRFCECGQEVQVDYVCPSNPRQWVAVVAPVRVAAERTEPVRVCPGCGRVLNIDRLL